MSYGSVGGYTPMPPEPPRGAAVGVAPPASVVMTVRLMLARAAVGVVSLIVLLTTKSSLRAAIVKKNPTSDTARLNTLVNAAIAVGVVFGVVFLVLYVLLALQGVRKGRNWARIVTFVLAALGVLGLLSSFIQPVPALSRVLGVLTAILDVAIIVFLARPSSREFFQRRPL